MKTTLDLPVELVREMKIRAAHEGRKIKDVATELLVAGMAAGRSGISAPHSHRGSLKFPLFVCTDAAPARRMTLEEILEVTQATQSQEDNEKLGQTF
jgi:hypothetical protein